MSTAVALVVPTQHPAIVEARDKVAAIRERALAVVVNSEQDKTTATEILSQLARVRLLADTERKKLVRPFNDHVDAINALFKDVLAPLADVDTRLRDRVLAFNRVQKRLAEEAAAAAEAERIRSAALLKEAEKAEAAGQGAVAGELLERAVASETAATTAQAEAVLPTRTVRTEQGTSTVRRVWTFKVLNLAEVPAEYLALDADKVRDAVRGFARTGSLKDNETRTDLIPGVEIFQEDQLAVKP